MHPEELKSVLKNLETKLLQNSPEALSTLTIKQLTVVPEKEESSRHKLAAPEDVIKSWLGKNVRNKIFLDYACRGGQFVLASSHLGASLSIGLDIDGALLGEAKKNKSASNCFYIQGDCENTGLPNESVDLILAKGILGHVDLSFALPELRRILKPGGKVLAIVPWEQNPVAKVYHRLVKDKSLSQKDLEFAQNFFEITNIGFYQIFLPAAQFIPSKNLKSQVGRMCKALDDFITKIPGFQKLAWQISFELVKPR